jgi:hypothetical protein
MGQRDLDLMEGGILFLCGMIHLVPGGRLNRMDGIRTSKKRLYARGQFRFGHRLGRLQHGLSEGDTQVLGQPLYLFQG